MAYDKINFEDNITPLDAENLNHMEDGIAANADDIDTLSADLTDLIVVNRFSIEAFTMTGGQIQSLQTFTITNPDGYTNIGVVGVDTGNNNIRSGRAYLTNSTTIRYSFQNIQTASQDSNGATFYVLAVKNRG